MARNQGAPSTKNEKECRRSGAGPSKKVPQVYVLELEGGLIYVGKSSDPKRRLAQHTTGKGATFTKKHAPTGRFLERIGTLEGDGDGPERDETLRQMHRNGFDKVRGWKYCCRTLSREDRAEIESNIREMLDLCRRCGRGGHFAKGCKHKTDRQGMRVACK